MTEAQSIVLIGFMRECYHHQLAAGEAKVGGFDRGLVVGGNVAMG